MYKHLYIICTYYILGGEYMREEGEFMPALMEQLDIKRIENELPNPNRLQASDLRHSKKWKELLQDYATIEIISSGETIAQLNTPDLIPTLIQKIKLLEQEVEQLKIERLYSERLKEKQLLSGAALEDAAHSLLDQYLQNGEIK